MDWIFKPLTWLFARRPGWRDAFGWLLLRLGRPFYVVLAIVFVVAGGWDQFVHRFTSDLSNASFDWLMRQRPLSYPPDPAIAVLDIDEASLGEMGEELGRWPWPRQVLALVASQIEANGAQAVVYDILFADADVANPQSEEAFDRYVTGSDKSFYPALRLDPANDHTSEIQVATLNFAERAPGQVGNGAATVAILTPYFGSIYRTTRIGTYNVYPDPDNVIRNYRNYELLDGYRLPSLPYRVGRALGWPVPERVRSRLNWPRDPTTYETVPFVEAYRAAQADTAGYFGKFAGKTVIVGSTAATLNDIKATPVDHSLPGVYALATAIDNTKHDAFLLPMPGWSIWLVEVLLLAASAHLFLNTTRAVVVSQYFLVVPTVLLGLSLLSVSVGRVLLDLSVPAAITLTYFAVAGLYDRLRREFAGGTDAFAFRATEISGRVLQVAVLPPAMSREAVLDLVRQSGIKLWDPLTKGLGEAWHRQGWIVWRWQDERAPCASAALHWITVDAGLAHAVAQALSEAKNPREATLSGASS